jgi:hypothetical protein
LGRIEFFTFLAVPLPEQLFELMLHSLNEQLLFAQFLGLIANLAMGCGKIVRKWAVYRMSHTIYTEKLAVLFEISRNNSIFLVNNEFYVVIL